MPTLYTVFIFAGLLLPLLLNFGLFEFLGTLLNKIMRPIFNLPGQSAIDCITSWLGGGTVGILYSTDTDHASDYRRHCTSNPIKNLILLE